jgi:hypothetical protein
MQAMLQLLVTPDAHPAVVTTSSALQRLHHAPNVSAQKQADSSSSGTSIWNVHNSSQHSNRSLQVHTKSAAATVAAAAAMHMSQPPLSKSTIVAS